MSESRSSSALFKRAEQLRRWEESETNRQPSDCGNKPKKIKFSSGCVFLAACASSDKEEVLNLLKTGADINTVNVDGLTALHQACIDNNMDMVEFLVENKADVNRGDNEGWTPLHATASCGFISIAKYLIEHGASVGACNNDGELPIDIAESDEMEDLLQRHIDLQGINCEDARTFEERSMLEDAKYWLSTGCVSDSPNPKTGATALHVAAAKGYIKVMNILLQAGVDLNAQDFDGWTPLHAAAHWAQKEACELLVEHFCDMDIKNYVGQTCFDIADSDLVRFLEDLRKKQASMERNQNDINIRSNKRNNVLSKRRLSTDKNSLIKDKDASAERQTLEQSINEEDTSPADKMPKVDLVTKAALNNEHSLDIKNRLNRDEPSSKISSGANSSSTTANSQVPNNLNTTPSPVRMKAEDEIWWKPGTGLKRKTELKNLELNLDNKESSESSSIKCVSPTVPKTESSHSDVAIRRTKSFEADEKYARRCIELRAKINAGNSCPALDSGETNTSGGVSASTATPNTSSTLTPIRSASLKEKSLWRRSMTKDDVRSSLVTCAPASTSTTTTTTSSSSTTISPPSSTTTSPQHSLTSVRRSFVPPVRDEESETQRKAHAKRVRETRRSTQGVTLEELKSAEQLVKKKQQQQLVQASQQFMLEDARDANNSDKNRVRGATDTAETTVTIPLRRPNKLVDSDKEQDKENDSRNAQATQAVIQRRKRPKRRSTGVVHVDLDDLDPGNQDKEKLHNDHEDVTNCNSSGGGRSRVSSISSSHNDTSSRPPSENGEIDYKKLYEESQAELSRLRDTLTKTEEELSQVKASCNKNSLSEQEKRERRTMERKLSEMEVELKELDQYKKENQRLKDENGALIRVISKLSK